jgi:hypothetical protein
MATTEERLKILKMVEEGKISPEEGAKLLAALSESAGNKSGSSAGATSSYANVRSAGGARWLRVRVTDIATGKQKVSVNLPIGLVKSGAQGKIIDVTDDEDGEHVEIYVE